MSIAGTPRWSWRLEQAEVSRLTWAFAISLACHLLVFGTYETGKKYHLWQNMHWPAWLQAPKGSGIKTDSFMVSADGGKFDQVRNAQTNTALISSAESLTGHLKGVNAGPISADFNLTSTITDPSVHFSQNVPGKAAATMVGVVAGNPGGDKNGIAQAVELFLETASPQEIKERLHEDIYLTSLEVTVG